LVSVQEIAGKLTASAGQIHSSARNRQRLKSLATQRNGGPSIPERVCKHRYPRDADWLGVRRPTCGLAAGVLPVCKPTGNPVWVAAACGPNKAVNTMSNCIAATVAG